MEHFQLTSLSIEDFREIVSDAIKEQLDKIELEPSDQLLTRQALALKLSISLPTLNHYTNEGILISHRIGNRVYYRWSDVLNSAIKVEPKRNKF
jgi:hypothetical protein